MTDNVVEKSVDQLTREAIETVMIRVTEILDKRFGNDVAAKIKAINEELASNKWPKEGIAEGALKEILRSLQEKKSLSFEPAKQATQKEEKGKRLWRKTYERRRPATVSIPKSLILRVDEYLNRPDSIYKNRADFVLTAIRKELSRLGLLEP